MYNYPYYELVMNGPLTQIEKMPMVLAFFQQININIIDEKLLMYFWMLIRIIKSLLFEILYTFCGTYMIYCWYYDDWKRGLKIFIKGIIIALIIMLVYNIFEILYLMGNNWAERILIKITPYFHTIKTAYNWWPPLLWKGQLRSYFSEPSNYGTYFAVVMPFLWYKIVKYENRKSLLIYSILIIFFTFCLFLTNARTAVALFLGELILLFLFTLIVRNRKLFCNAIIIIICSMFAFVSSNIFISNYIKQTPITNTIQKVTKKVEIEQNNNIKPARQEINNQANVTKTKKTTEINKTINRSSILNENQFIEYIENNLLSLINLNKRSNNARYSTIIADFNIGLNNPMLGVGTGLRNAYVPEYLPEFSKKNKEVNLWINLQKEKGILKSGFPNLCEYTNKFAETGILGLGIFLLPAIILLKNLLMKIKDNSLEFSLKAVYIYFTIAFIGIMASAIGSTINATYFYWILLGLGYAMCFGKENDVKDNGDTSSWQEH